MKERLWQHDETGRMVWSVDPGPRWFLVPMMFEDELPDDMTNDDYDEWYKWSRVPDGVGCRMGPRFP
jgi:hypothetical protein